jgi:hypothetical protein
MSLDMCFSTNTVILMTAFGVNIMPLKPCTFYAGFEILTAALTKCMVRVLTLCSLVKVHEHLRGTYMYDLGFQGQRVSQACHLVPFALLLVLLFQDRAETFLCNGSRLLPKLRGITTQNSCPS